MTENPCADIRDLIPELGAGVASGDDRARALRHMAGCAKCRRELDAAAMVADEILTLIPGREPPPGFESAVLRRLAPVRPRRLRRRLLTAAAIALAMALAAGGVWQATGDDRFLADHYRRALAGANGQYVIAKPFPAPDGSVAGRLVAYQGDPSWIFITVRVAQPYTVWLVSRQGARPLGTFATGSFGMTIDVPVHSITEIRLSRTGAPDLVAAVTAD